MSPASRTDDWEGSRAVMVAELLNGLPPRIDVSAVIELLAVSADAVRLGILEGTLSCGADGVDTARSRRFLDRESSDRLPLPAYLRPSCEFLSASPASSSAPEPRSRPTRSSPTRGTAP